MVTTNHIELEAKRLLINKGINPSMVRVVLAPIGNNLVLTAQEGNKIARVTLPQPVTSLMGIYFRQYLVPAVEHIAQLLGEQ